METGTGRLTYRQIRQKQTTQKTEMLQAQGGRSMKESVQNDIWTK